MFYNASTWVLDHKIVVFVNEIFIQAKMLHRKTVCNERELKVRKIECHLCESNHRKQGWIFYEKKTLSLALVFDLISNTKLWPLEHDSYLNFLSMCSFLGNIMK